MPNETTLLLILAALGALLAWFKGRDHQKKKQLDKRFEELKEHAKELGVPSEEEKEARARLEELDKKEAELEEPEEVTDPVVAVRGLRKWFNDRTGRTGGTPPS